MIAGAARETGSQSSVLFRWTAQTGMVGLGRPAGTDAITAVDIPSDGSTIIGRADLILPGGGIFDVPFVWSQAHDMQTLAEYLDIRGGIPIGLAADRATLTGISEDGLVLVGYEVDTQGLIRSFILDLRTPVSTHRVWPYLAIALGMVALDAIRRMGNRSARILPSWSR
ncbi:MAG TPA: hypothetical protein ENI85_13815 [Deltaproteobacteria bacterium]|nr:hypothetical protein [Deltaproteobacteria bacterium]